ncbi:UNVERIFIED_CONTAM: hypothetical protein K2H54_030515 [Gekko kuhli]
MVAWALGLGLGGSPAGHKDAGDQGLWQEGEEGLHRMLLAFLREDPSAGDFFTLLDDPMPEVSPSATSEPLASPLEQNTAKEPPARSKASSPPWGRGGFREPVQSPLGFSGPLEILAVLLVDSTS